MSLGNDSTRLGVPAPVTARVSATRTGILVGAVLALTWIVLGFWAFVFVVVAMALGAVIGRALDGRLDIAALVGAFRGKRSSS
ncbi:DUF2273 domain-containing protein [Subtercola frigoramans]|uniref:Membrane protein n=1 Tax=Subtercola frigoramans TaxID=120298 RepID=A0ABS2L047_9MICO|nr:DUF2273 domain-containing protein [Subtercola frigoramans]MBM7470452.1 putative membrane protein [Subtercola frigoramans]